MEPVRRFPALLWIPMYAGSLFLLFVGTAREKALFLAIGIVLSLIPTLYAFKLTLERRRNQPRPPWLIAFILGTALFYVVIAVVVGVASGLVYGLAAVLAALYPLAAVALWVATARTKTVGSGDRPSDTSASDHTDPFPGIGADDERPMGDSGDVHDEISPHDLPKGHPGRPAAARLAREHAGTTRGHSAGGAAAAENERHDGDLVGPDEEEGARTNGAGG